ncbi:hypothetical protein RA19_04460 [Leisingera sp. ANG-M1]|uniref:hypothetical protein n=1 Tax=Leisingera sp. ANG-M1 TaxID=1577895 RepID=UPI0005801961|nr:hypothetical protein [Leisingera sp. ANG-M1]KIC11892.1 hypothetical protein RA19_04460 [Leisingera sp. ANG-M1]
MTEITARTGSPLYKDVRTSRHLVDPVAFALAMAGGPLTTGLFGAPLLIPPFAAIFGGPLYLVIGVPVMLNYMRRHRPAPGKWAQLAFLTHLVIFTPILLLALATDGNIDGPSAFLLFGSVFAPIWGAVSGLLYRRFERDFYKQTI